MIIQGEPHLPQEGLFLRTPTIYSGEGNGTPLSTLAWKIPWTEEHGRLQSMGLQRAGHDLATSLSLSGIYNGVSKELKKSVP